MSSPKVSVIIPSYNYADYVATAVQSVLDQTFADFEVIVVDDGSKDHTAEVIGQFTDKRVQYIYQENRGLPAARNTGIKASSGELLAFLDADDRFHPDKLRTQAAFLDENPELGLTYNSRITFASSGDFLMLRLAPATVTLKDLVLGYPFAPSDVVIRREWVTRIGLFDESFVSNSEDLNFHLRLMLEGCRFAGVQRVLAYRKIHTGRIFRNIAVKMQTYLRALDTAFNDSRCPAEVLSIRDLAYADHYLTWTYQALVQGETSLGQDYLKETVRLNPAILADHGKKLVNFFVWASLGDGGDHETALRRVFEQLPSEFTHLSEYLPWAIARGYLQIGVRDVMWGRLKQARDNFEWAVGLGIQLDEQFLRKLTDQLLNYEAEFGTEAAQEVFQNLTPYLEKIGNRASVRWLNGCYAINQAFKGYQTGQYTKVPREIMRAVSNNPKHLANRGVLAMLVRSLFGAINQAGARRSNPLSMNDLSL